MALLLMPRPQPFQNRPSKTVKYQHRQLQLLQTSQDAINGSHQKQSQDHAQIKYYQM